MKISTNQERTKFKIIVTDSDQINYQIRLFLTIVFIFTIILLTIESIFGSLADSLISVLSISPFLIGFGYLIVQNGLTILKEKTIGINIDLKESYISYSRSNSVKFEIAAFVFKKEYRELIFEIYLECEDPSCIYFREIISTLKANLDDTKKNEIFDTGGIKFKSD